MAEISILPSETRIATHWGTGSLGSETVALECPDPNALKRAVEALSERFRKVYLDGVRGIALLMAPTRAHDRTSHDMDDLVRALAACRSIPIEAFGGGRWENEAGDRRSEPDESFYIGEVAVAYRKLRLRQDWDAVEAFEEAHPATLVVEVEHTHYAAEKRELCRALGMGELWEVGTRHARRPPAIVELQGPEGPRELEASGLIPGVRPPGVGGPRGDRRIRGRDRGPGAQGWTPGAADAGGRHGSVTRIGPEAGRNPKPSPHLVPDSEYGMVRGRFGFLPTERESKMAEPKPIEKLASALQECLNEAVELGANKALEKIEPRLDRQDAIQDKQNRTLRMFWKQMKGKGPLPIDED